VRRAWVGEPPRASTAEQLDAYRAYASTSAQAHWGDDELIGGADAAKVVDGLVEVAVCAGVDALNLRLHVPGVEPEAVREQIVTLGSEVVPQVRAALQARAA
jgi:hypothetical protein